MAISDIQITVRGAGDLIRQLREDLELAAKDLATRANLDPSVLSRIEHNTLGMSTDVLSRIAVALRLDPIQLAERCIEKIKFTATNSENSSNT